MVEFRILGPLEVVERGRVVALAGGKQRALLGVLLVHMNEVVSFDRLIDELWGDHPPATATKTVQVFVSQLRKSLGGRSRDGATGGALRTRGAGYVLEIDPSALDAQRFERQLVAGRRALRDGRPADAAETLHAGLALWRGPALLDFTYEPFAQAEIARLEDLRLAALEERVEADLRLQRHADIVAELQALVADYPLREGLWAKLMLALYRCERQAEALDAYQHVRARLVDELGLEPGPALRNLQRAILAHDAKLAPSRPVSLEAPIRPAAPAPVRIVAPNAAGTSLPGALEHEADTVFFGRRRELERLEALLADTYLSGRTVVLIAGEPGAGKTRLAAEFGRRASDRRARVLYGRCEREPLMPFAPFVEALRDHVARCPDEELAQLPTPAAAELSRWLPELGERLPGLGPSGAENVATERVRLFEGVESLLSLAAAAAPLVLILDDLHWADQGTLALVGHLSRDPRPASLLIVATYRDAEVSPGYPVAETIADLRRAETSGLLTLGGLEEDELAAMIGAWTGQPPSAALARALWRETEGHPLFAQELVRHLLEKGALYERNGRMTTEVALEAIGIPDTVKQIVASRLARLPEGCQRVLAHAAVIGRDFDVAVLDDVGAVHGEALDELLEQALAAHLINEPPAGVGRYCFSHALIREALYERLSRTHRSRLHLRVGEAVERRQKDDAEAVAQLARHFLRAGEDPAVLDKAIDYAVAAARHATSQLAFEQAADHYRSALAVLVRRAADEARQCELLLDLGRNEFKAGMFARGKATLRRAGELGERLGLAGQLAHAALGFAGPFGFARIVVDEPVVELLERALAQLPDEDSPLRAEVMARLAEALTFSPQRDRAEALGRGAVDMARRLGDERVLASVLAHATFATWGPDNLDERLAAGEEICALTEHVAPRHEPEGRFFLASALLERADPDRFEREFEAWRRLCEEKREPLYIAFVELATGVRALSEGELEEAEMHARRALDVAPPAENPTILAMAGMVIGGVRQLQGRMAEQRAGATAAAHHFAGRTASRIPLLLVETELARAAAVREEFELWATDDFGDLPRDMEWLFCMEVLADACVFLSDARRAATLYRLLEPYSGRVVLGAGLGARGAAARSVAGLAAVMRVWQDAERHFATAIELNTRMKAAPALARTRVEYAQMLLARDEPGDRVKALRLLDEASERAERSGWHALLARCSALRNGAAGENGEPRKPPRRRLGELASRTRADARTAVSERARIVLARYIRTANDVELERRLGSPLVQRALFAAAARSFQPRMAFGFQGAIVIELTHVPVEPPARPSDWWTLAVDGKKATARRGASADPALTVHISIPDLVRNFCGELNPLTALVDGRIRVEGDLFLGARLEEMFGGAPLFETLSGSGQPSPPDIPVPA